MCVCVCVCVCILSFREYKAGYDETTNFEKKTSPYIRINTVCHDLEQFKWAQLRISPLVCY